MDNSIIGRSLGQALNDLRSNQQSFCGISLSLNSVMCNITLLGAPSLSAHRRTIVKARQVLPDLIDVPVSSLTLVGAPLEVSSMQASAQTCIETVKVNC